MVKNTTGGKNKNQARKHVAVKTSQSLRISTNELEMYAQVTKVLGNGMCHVYCIDKQSRLCYIRGKFSGRGKRDNFIGIGTWVLVGLREWESSSKEKQSCDLMEVYQDQDKERLKSKCPDYNWKLFTTVSSSNANKANDKNDDIEFMNDQQEDYFNLMQTIETKQVVEVIQFDNAIHNNNNDANDIDNVKIEDYNFDDI